VCVILLYDHVGLGKGHYVVLGRSLPINPLSHGGPCVSRLIAVDYMRQQLCEGDIGENEDGLIACACVCSLEQTGPAKKIQNRVTR
jgi:hypothetical protein